jgi:hypothetical protein
MLSGRCDGALQCTRRQDSCAVGIVAVQSCVCFVPDGLLSRCRWRELRDGMRQRWRKWQRKQLWPRISSGPG